jgi:hypothetical protein
MGSGFALLSVVPVLGYGKQHRRLAVWSYDSLSHAMSIIFNELNISQECVVVW